MKNRSVYRTVGVILVVNLKEDQTDENRLISELPEEAEPTANFKGAYLLISNRTDCPDKVVCAYQKRWRIEILFRNSKQELRLCQCHSTNENHLEAHVALLFTAETLLRCAEWEQNENVDPDERLTHGQVTQLLFRTHCTIKYQSIKKMDVAHVYFDTAVRIFASLFLKYWPDIVEMKWFNPFDCNIFPTSD